MKILVEDVLLCLKYFKKKCMKPEHSYEMQQEYETNQGVQLCTDLCSSFHKHTLSYNHGGWQQGAWR